MLIRKLKRNSELRDCLDISLGLFKEAAPPEFPVNDTYCKNQLMVLARTSQYFRVVEKDDAVVGWIMAFVSKPFHFSDTTALIQNFYHSNLTGVAAAKALVMSHEDMFQAGRLIGVDVVMTSSFLSTSEVFKRILQKHGWVDRGNSLVRKVYR